MTEDRIERDTLISAPLERVWSLVATPGFWVADEASVAGAVVVWFGLRPRGRQDEATAVAEPASQGTTEELTASVD
jgi:hypothetical protein